jgi:two-component system sensor kinase FixL
MATSRILVGALSHEVRNLSAAAASASHSLESIPGVAESDGFHALRTIHRSLNVISSSGLSIASENVRETADLQTVLDETRIIIEPGLRELGAMVEWKVAPDIPMVQANHHSLLQVLLNLVRNSETAMAECEQKRLTVEAGVENDLIMVRIRDNGCGIANPESLFRPFQSGSHSSGLGLYIARAIVRSHGGELRFEAQPQGSCFAVELWPADSR